VPDRVEARKRLRRLVGSVWLVGMRLCGSDVQENPNAACSSTLVRVVSGNDGV